MTASPLRSAEKMTARAAEPAFLKDTKITNPVIFKWQSFKKPASGINMGRVAIAVATSLYCAYATQIAS